MGDRKIASNFASAKCTLLNLLKAVETAEQIEEIFYIVYLYYDMTVSCRPLIIDDPHYPATLRERVLIFDVAEQKLATPSEFKSA